MDTLIKPSRRKLDVTPKSKIIKAYAPNLSDGAARKRLALWISSCKPLCKALAKTGYNIRQRYFTDKQIRLIYKYLGEP